MTNEGRQHEIALEAFETVVDGGVRRVSWHVAEGERWLAAASYPGANVELVDRTPGVVWRRRVQLCLPKGARLMRVETTPERATQRDPLAYLWRPDRGAKQRVQRTYFLVGASGSLVRSPQAAG